MFWSFAQSYLAHFQQKGWYGVHFMEENLLEGAIAGHRWKVKIPQNLKNDEK